MIDRNGRRSSYVYSQISPRLCTRLSGGTLQSGCMIGTEEPLVISCSRWSDHSENNNIVWRPTGPSHTWNLKHGTVLPSFVRAAKTACVQKTVQVTGVRIVKNELGGSAAPQELRCWGHNGMNWGVKPSTPVNSNPASHIAITLSTSRYYAVNRLCEFFCLPGSIFIFLLNWIIICVIICAVSLANI